MYILLLLTALNSWKAIMEAAERANIWNGGSYVLLRSGPKIFKMSLDDSEDAPVERSQDHDGHSGGSDKEYDAENYSDEGFENSEEEYSAQDSNDYKDSGYSAEDCVKDHSDYSDEYNVNHSHDEHSDNYHESEYSKLNLEANEVSEKPEHQPQQNCFETATMEPAKLTLERTKSGMISLVLVFEETAFQKLKSEMCQSPPHTACLKYVITVENRNIQELKHTSEPTCIKYRNVFLMKHRMKLGSDYKIKVMVQKFSYLDKNFRTFTTLEVCHRAVLQKWELKMLMNKAEHFKLSKTNGEKLPVEYAYRNKSHDYFENIKNNRKNIMEVYIKDNNGDPGCPINGQIDGLFFGVRPHPGKMAIPDKSPFGERRIILPIDELVKSNARLYFADFWCHYNTHYVTLVVTKPDTVPDTFCKEHLLELLLERNPFFFCHTPTFGQDNAQNMKFYCCTEPRVEILYTENVNLNEEYITWATVKTLGRCGSSTPGGIPKQPHCSICNLYPIQKF